MTDSTVESLLASANAMGLALSDAQASNLLSYLALIAKWNAVYNLTAIREADEMLRHHVLDSLAVVRPLRKMSPNSGATLIDVGSGAGLPGVVVAIADYTWAVTCVDAVAKKVGFITQVVAELGLHNLRAVHSRIENYRAASADVITSRAFSSLAQFTSSTRHLIGPGGVWMALKGKVPNDEMAALPGSVEMFHVEQLEVPGLGAERCIVWMRPRSR